MKRSHRLLREAHRQRVERAAVARGPDGYDALGESPAMEATVLALVRIGLFEPRAFHPGMGPLVAEALERLGPDVGGRGLSGRLGRALAAAAFPNRARGADGRVVLGGGDRKVALACAAVGEAAVFDRVVRALCEVLRRRALDDHRLRPAWPDGYLDRRAREAAAALAEARAVATGFGGPLDAVAAESEAV